MPRFVSAKIEPVGAAWSLTVVLWSVWSGEWSETSVHLTLMEAVDALLVRRCERLVKYIGPGGVVTNSLPDYLRGRTGIPGGAPAFAVGEKKEELAQQPQ